MCAGSLGCCRLTRTGYTRCGPQHEYEVQNTEKHIPGPALVSVAFIPPKRCTYMKKKSGRPERRPYEPPQQPLMTHFHFHTNDTVEHGFGQCSVAVPHVVAKKTL